MSEYNWDQFTKRITIKASAQDVYKAWATQSGLESWFLRKAVFTDISKRQRDPNYSFNPEIFTNGPGSVTRIQFTNTIPLSKLTVMITLNSDFQADAS